MKPFNQRKGVVARPVTRRSFLALASATGALACFGRTSPVSAYDNEAVIQARPRRPSTIHSPGLHQLGLSTDRDGLVYIPRGHNSKTNAPLAVMLKALLFPTKGR